MLLFGAARMDSAQARDWIAGVAAALYGLPALGTLTLTGGEISIGGVGLGVAALLALYGRRLETLASPAPGAAPAPERVRVVATQAAPKHGVRGHQPG